MAATAKTQIGGSGYRGPKVYKGTAAPTVLNDIADGVDVGDLFLNTTTPDLYVCTANTAGAAAWKKFTLT